MLLFFQLVIALTSLILLASAFEDLKTGEISDYKSLGLTASIILISAGYSVYSLDFQVFLTSLLWGLIFFIFSYILFYLGQWGGGDVKLMAAIGASLGLLSASGFVFVRSSLFGYAMNPLITYAMNMAFLSAPFAILYTVVLGFRKPKAIRDFVKKMKTPQTLIITVLALIPAVAAVYLGVFELAIVYLMVPIFFVATIYMKTVEETVLTKTIDVNQLSDWDILANDLIVDGKRIATKRNIEGVTPEQVKKIKKLATQKKIPPQIDIRWGLKFAPVLFICYPVTVLAGNIIEMFFELILNR